MGEAVHPGRQEAGEETLNKCLLEQGRPCRNPKSRHGPPYICRPMVAAVPVKAAVLTKRALPVPSGAGARAAGRGFPPSSNIHDSLKPCAERQRDGSALTQSLQKAAL